MNRLKRIKKRSSGGGWPAIFYALRKARSVGLRRMWRALKSKNACKTCALGMGGQLGGMVNEKGRFPEVCKKSVQAMAADLQGAVHPHFFDDFSLEQLKAFSSRELEASGRLVQPLYAGPLDSHYRKITWDEAIDRISKKLKKIDPKEAFFYFSGRSSNEAGFLMQLFARLWGTNNINNCSFYCHQASGVGLASVTGSGTATITLDDLDLLRKSDVLFLIGANPASNHPRFMRTLVDLKRRGAKVIVINPLREIGLVRFRVPSDPRSLLLGSKIANEYVQPHIGGDIALLSGIAKALMERDRAMGATHTAAHTAINYRFVSEHTDNWTDVRDHLAALDWATIVHRSGVDRATIERLAGLYAHAHSAIFCWAMGITHHAHGVQNVQAIANLAIMRGMLGRPGAGLLPLRGHSNVQGMGSMGVSPVLRQAVFEKLESTFGVKLPKWKGLDTLASIEHAHKGTIRFASCLGGNLFGSSPDAAFAHQAMGEIDLVMYMSTTLNTGHAWGRGKETIILPVLARDEETQATTQESMFNYVRLSDGGDSRHNGPRSEVQTISRIAHAVLGEPGDEQPIHWRAMADHSNIRELIGRIIPGYEAIAEIDQTRVEFTIPGRIFHESQFQTRSGRAAMHVIELPELIADPAHPNGSAKRGRKRAKDQPHPKDQPPSADAAPEVNRLLRLMTIRSEGQFNTVVYEEEDIYRGQERRDVILMNRSDIERLGLKIDQPVTVSSETGSLPIRLVREGDLPPGNCAMYSPESNVLVPRTVDPESHTPAFKSVAVTIEPTPAAPPPSNNGHASHADRLPPAPAPAPETARAKLNAC
ncbi:MAG: FdhF/YdeP family oxidoreductase [Phycisphaerales bacterium]|nr:FdhF/YdeP family oxidoreductase [Phycisphaerales bacterium]